jgi:hypothetical protein
MSTTRDEAPRSQNGTRPHDQRVLQTFASRSVHPFDPMGDARVARLRLARTWRDEGAIFQALCAYNDMLVRFRHTPTAEAAAEELLEMATVLQREGMFYTALNIFSKIEAAS